MGNFFSHNTRHKRMRAFFQTLAHADKRGICREKIFHGAQKRPHALAWNGQNGYARIVQGCRQVSVAATRAGFKREPSK
jgi:hypothetical protein